MRMLLVRIIECETMYKADECLSFIFSLATGINTHDVAALKRDDLDYTPSEADHNRVTNEDEVARALEESEADERKKAAKRPKKKKKRSRSKSRHSGRSKDNSADDTVAARRKHVLEHSPNEVKENIGKKPFNMKMYLC